MEKVAAATFRKDKLMVTVIQKRDRKADTPLTIECEKCETPFELWQPLVNTCDCGANYNGFGQRLVENPDYWSDKQDW